MTTRVTRAADWLMAHTPATAVMRRGVDLVVLAYHGVDDRRQFGAHLDHIVASYEPVSLDDVLAAVDGSSLPPRAALITFDDGERTVLTAGLPELESRGLPSVLFAVPGVLDSEAPFWWVEAESLIRAGASSDLIPGPVAAKGSASVVRYLKIIPDVKLQEILADLRAEAEPVRTSQLTSEELAVMDGRGMRVENHSLTHPLLDMCTDEKITSEILTAHALLAEVLGREPSVFAYPNGNVDDRVVGVLRDHGYRAAFLFDHRITPLPVSDPLRVSRVRVNSTTTTDRFISIAAGVHPALHQARGGT